MEEERIVRPRVLDEPLHAANLRNDRKVSPLLASDRSPSTYDVRTCRQAHLRRVGRVEQHDDVLLLVVVSLAQEFGHVAGVVLAAVQLVARACESVNKSVSVPRILADAIAYRCLQEETDISEDLPEAAKPDAQLIPMHKAFLLPDKFE